MEKNLLSFLEELVKAPSPSGFEQAAQDVYRKFVSQYADEVKTDFHGNVIALKKGKGKKRVMLVGHVDEIGFIVKYIDDRGFIRFSPIGTMDCSLTPGHRVNIYHEDKVIHGVIGVKPAFMHKEWVRDKVVTLDELWIDIGAKDKKDAEKAVSVGDRITYSHNWQRLPNNLITTKSADNKVGVFITAAVLSNLYKQEINANIYCVSSVQEEIGGRGVRTSAFGVDPHIGIAVDLTHAIDYPTLDPNIYGEIKLNEGIVITVGANINPRVLELQEKAAKEANVKYQIEAIPGPTLTDAFYLQISREGVATGVLTIPARYMHTPSEIVSLTDIEDAIKVLTHFCKMIDDDTNLIP